MKIYFLVKHLMVKHIFDEINNVPIKYLHILVLRIVKVEDVCTFLYFQLLNQYEGHLINRKRFL